MKKVGLLWIGLCLFCFGVYSVKADNITYKKLDDINFNLTVDGKKESNYVTMFYLDNRLAYCIEPGKDITTKIYDSFPDWSKTKLTEQQQAEIEAIGYYGYEYPNHQTPRYYIAAQELIWKAVKNIDIYWTTNGGEAIDITKEKEEIRNLVNKHKLIPSFSYDVITGKLGEEKTIEDTNKVLENYTLNNTSSHSVNIEENTLKVNFSNELKDYEEVSLTRNNYDNKTLLIYIKENSQQLAALRFSNKQTVTFKLKNEKEPEEIVRVPSTYSSLKTKRFNIVHNLTTYEQKFN